MVSALIIAFSATSCSSDSDSKPVVETGDLETSVSDKQISEESTTKSSKYDFDVSTYEAPEVHATTPDYTKNSFDRDVSEVEAGTATLTMPTVPKINLEINESVKANPYVATDNRGAVSLDAEVLFAYNSAELSGKGKESIKSFLDDYVKAVFNDDGTTDVKKITVEGHTDTDGSYEYNQKLSENRAKNVMDYCNELHPELKKYLVAKGCSYDFPVYKADGSVDMTASRRVCFVAE